jgi:tRNA uridine 5-carboxymethylaminomethyl modification enzyme
VNGTSGYEEAASQGLMAGINAALKTKHLPPLILSRTESYIGVMLDDLTSMEILEPYRMFTSRAEYRLSLREDNADQRLRKIGWELGLVSDQEYARFQEKAESIKKTVSTLKETWIKTSEDLNKKLEEFGTAPLYQAQTAYQLLKRPELSFVEVKSLLPNKEVLDSCNREVEETVEVEVKYEGYISI